MLDMLPCECNIYLMARNSPLFSFHVCRFSNGRMAVYLGLGSSRRDAVCQARQSPPRSFQLVSDALLLHHTKDSAHIPLHSCPTATMFARRAVSTVARRAVTSRPAVPVRSFASSMKRCECAIFLTESGEPGIEAIGAGRMLEIEKSRLEKKIGGLRY